jgi:hypothetical protein
MKDRLPKQIDLQPGIDYQRIGEAEERVPAINWRNLAILIVVFGILYAVNSGAHRLADTYGKPVFDRVIAQLGV